MKYNKIYMLVALLGVVMTGCQKEQNVEPVPSSDGDWTLTVKVSKDTDTKALELDESTLNAYWKKGEKVAVYLDGTKVGELEVTSDDKVTPAVLSGKIDKDAPVAVGSSLMLLFPGRDDALWTYEGQTGYGPSAGSTISDKFDYATTTLSVATLDDVNHVITVTSTSAFANQQSIYRFGFKVGGAGEAIAIKSFIVSSAQDKLVRSMTYDAGNWVPTYGSLSLNITGDQPLNNLYYLAIRNENTSVDETYTFSVVGADNALYEGTRTVDSKNLGYGKFLGAKSINVSAKALAPKASGSISKEIEVL